MSEKRERLRAGIAMLEAIAGLLDKASTELGSARPDKVQLYITNAAAEVRAISARCLRDYDRSKP